MTENSKDSQELQDSNLQQKLNVCEKELTQAYNKLIQTDTTLSLLREKNQQLQETQKILLEEREHSYQALLEAAKSEESLQKMVDALLGVTEQLAAELRRKRAEMASKPVEKTWGDDSNRTVIAKANEAASDSSWTDLSDHMAPAPTPSVDPRFQSEGGAKIRSMEDLQRHIAASGGPPAPWSHGLEGGVMVTTTRVSAPTPAKEAPPEAQEALQD